MKPREISKADIPRLIDAYRDAAKLHGELTESGDPKVANKAAKLVIAVYAELRRRGARAQAALLPLLADPAPGVRLWSASHALEFSPGDGEAVLTQLSSGGQLIGFNAEMTLKEWRAGRLAFP